MELNYAAMSFWLNVLLALSAFFATVYSWWVTRTRATTESIDKVNDRVSGVEQAMHTELNALHTEFTRIDALVSSLPNHDDIGKVYERLSDVEGGLNRVIGGLEALTRQASTIYSYLLNKER